MRIGIQCALAFTLLLPIAQGATLHVADQHGLPIEGSVIIFDGGEELADENLAEGRITFHEHAWTGWALMARVIAPGVDRSWHPIEPANSTLVVHREASRETTIVRVVDAVLDVPIAGARVEAISMAEVGWTNPDRFGYTDVEGTATLHTMAPPSHVFVKPPPGYVPASSSPVGPTVVLEPVPGASALVQISMAEATPEPVLVRVSSLDSSFVASVALDDHATLRVPPGLYELKAITPGFDILCNNGRTLEALPGAQEWTCTATPATSRNFVDIQLAWQTAGHGAAALELTRAEGGGAHVDVPAQGAKTRLIAGNWTATGLGPDVVVPPVVFEANEDKTVELPAFARADVTLLGRVASVGGAQVASFEPREYFLGSLTAGYAMSENLDTPWLEVAVPAGPCLVFAQGLGWGPITRLLTCEGGLVIGPATLAPEVVVGASLLQCDQDRRLSVEAPADHALAAIHSSGAWWPLSSTVVAKCPVGDEVFVSYNDTSAVVWAEGASGDGEGTLALVPATAPAAAAATRSWLTFDSALQLDWATGRLGPDMVQASAPLPLGLLLVAIAGAVALRSLSRE